MTPAAPDARPAPAPVPAHEDAPAPVGNAAFRAALAAARAARGLPPRTPAPAPEPPIVAPAAPEPPAAASPPGARRSWAIKLGAGVLLSATAVGIGVLLGLGTQGEPAPARAGAAPAGVVAADRPCLGTWNRTDTGDAAQLRVTLGQLTGAYARVQRVAPLPGTLMTDNACAVEVYDPASDAHAIFVAGVQGELGYVDVTSYPRAARYGWPTSAAQANVRILGDGTLRALRD